MIGRQNYRMAKWRGRPAELSKGGRVAWCPQSKIQNVKIARKNIPIWGCFSLYEEIEMVPLIGVEPIHLSVQDPKSGVSANFTTAA